jgi:hypothetical protein
MNRQVNVRQNAGLLSPHPSRNRLASERARLELLRRADVRDPAANAP